MGNEAFLDAYDPARDPVKYFARRQRMAAFLDGDPILGNPAEGAACNRCGMCCVLRPCWIGRMIFEVEEGECPALQWGAESAACGLMSRPQEFLPVRVRIEGATRVREAARFLIGQGVGCVRDAVVKNGQNGSRRRAALKVLGLLKKTTS